MLRFKPEWNPLQGLNSSKPKVVTMRPASPSDYQSLRDSIDALDLDIRSEQDPRALKALKDRKDYFWQKLENTRAALMPAPTDSSRAVAAEAHEIGGLVQILTKVLAGTAGVLAVVIVALVFVMRRRKAEVTRKLDALKTDERFKAPRGGFQEAADPTLVRSRRRAEGNQEATLPNVQPRSQTQVMPVRSNYPTAAQTSLPNVQPASISAEDDFPDLTVLATQTAGLRPTARQRVTNAIKGLAEALAALKTPPSVGAMPERPTRTRMRVASQNSTRYTQTMESTRYGLPDPHPLEATRFDREREEKGDIVKLARRGYTSSEIARRLRIAQDQVETVIRLQRESGD